MNNIHSSRHQIRTISSRSLSSPTLFLGVDLQEERGFRDAGGEVMGSAGVFLLSLAGGAGASPGEGADDADVLAMEDGENKGVCVEAVDVEGLEAEGGGKHGGAGFVVADGRSEEKEGARGSDRAAGGGGGEGVGGSEEFDGEYNVVGGKKEKGREDDGDKHPASSLSISPSKCTSPGGSIPYLRQQSWR